MKKSKFMNVFTALAVSVFLFAGCSGGSDDGTVYGAGGKLPDGTNPGSETPKAEIAYKITELPCDCGIKVKVTNLDGSDLIVSRAEYTQKNYDVQLFINGYFVTPLRSEGTDSINFSACDQFFPFVNPGEKVTVEVYSYVRDLDSDGNRIPETLKVKKGELDITPATGLGKVTCTGKLEYTFDENGFINVTSMPVISHHDIISPRLMIDFATGDGSWNNGKWVTGIDFTEPGIKNVYFYLDYVGVSGYEQCFVSAYLCYRYEVSENEIYEFRVFDYDFGSKTKVGSLNSLACVAERLNYTPQAGDVFEGLGSGMYFESSVKGFYYEKTHSGTAFYRNGNDFVCQNGTITSKENLRGYGYRLLKNDDAYYLLEGTVSENREWKDDGPFVRLSPFQKLSSVPSYLTPLIEGR